MVFNLCILLQNEDVALAKILQEQERAFLSLSGGTRYVYMTCTVNSDY